MTSPDALTAVTAALAVEHETIYAYAVIAAHADAAAGPLARSAYDAHVGARDRLAALVRAAGGTPTAADAAYAITRPVTDRASTLALAAAVEDGCAVAYEKLVVAADDAALRASAANALVECATRASRWRLLAGSRQTMAFPGRG